MGTTRHRTTDIDYSETIMNNFIKRSECPACKEKNCVEIYSCDFLKDPVKKFLERKFSRNDIFEYFKGARYNLYECKNCSLVFQNEILNDFFMNKLYDEWLNYFDAEIHECCAKTFTLNTASYYVQEIVKIINFLKKEPSAIDVLDFGMGWGRWCLMARAFGCNSFGAELSNKRAEHAKSNGISVIEINKLNKYEFDFINTEQVFEHLPEPFDILKLLKKSLKDEGIIKISVPDGRNIKKRLKLMDWTAPRNSKQFLMPVTPLIHINCFNYKSIIAMANKAGFKHIHIPFKCEYSSTYNLSTKNVMKNAIRPIYRRLMKKTYLFFMKRGGF